MSEFNQNNQNGFNNDGTYRFGGTGTPLPNQTDSSRQQYAQPVTQQYNQQYGQQYNGQTQQHYNAQAQQNPYQSQMPNYQQPVNQQLKPKKQKSSGGINIPTLVTAALLAAVIGVGGGFIGAKLGSSSSTETIIQSSDGSTVIFQSIDRTSDDDSQSSYSVADVASAVADTVVEITTETVTTNNYLGQYVTEGAGSGVIITTDGYIVTNHHVIEDASTITVTLTSGESYSATVVGDDEESDLAVLRIEATGLTPAVFGDSDSLVVGQTAIAIGNPLGELGGTVTSGIISALDREIEIDGETMTLLQTSAAINPGNSGGGLFDDEGNLIGIVNAKSSGTDIEGLGFAIPSNTVKAVAADLIEYGYVTGRVALGISVVSVDSNQTARMYGVTETGLYISSVEDNSSASEAGLSVGDKIVSFNGIEISDDTDLTSALDDCSVGDTVVMVIRRNGTDYEVNVTLKEAQG